MPPKKKGKKTADQNEAKLSLAFEPIVYITNKPEIMIEMLESPENKLLLRVIGTLHKTTVGNDDNLQYFLSCGLYDKLIILLKSPDVYILRFTLSFVKKVILKVVDLTYNLEFAILLTTANLVKILYLSRNDELIKSLSTNILVTLAKHNQLISNEIYSRALVTRIFDILKVDKKLELAIDNMELLFYILDSSKAEKEILNCSGFSIVILLCLFDSNHIGIKYMAIDILHKLAIWKRSDMLMALVKAKVAEAITRVLISELADCSEKAFEIIYGCLSDSECVNNYVKSLEFVKFLEWVKACPKTSAGHAALILKSLSDHEELLQVLFDFSMEESAISLFRFVSEAVILNVCGVILNMMRHKYCCEKMATPALMKILIEIINADDLFSTIPYGEIALQTLYRFFQGYIATVQIVHESGCIMMLLDIFIKSKKQMSAEGYSHIIEIMEILSKSQYFEEIRNIGMYQSIIDYYAVSSAESSKLLVIMESYFECSEFRELFLERNVLGAMMDKILRRKNIDSSAEILVAVKKLIAYKRIALAFIDQGYLGELKYIKDNFKFHTSIVDQIIDALFDFCLTLKFFFKHKLGENDKIRDQFILIPDAFMSIETQEINFNSRKLSEHIPIYVVSLQELMYEGSSVKSTLDIMDILEQPFFAESRRLAQRTSHLSPFHRLAVFAAKLFSSCDDVNSIVSRESSFVGDSDLAKIIGDINAEIHEENPMAYRKLQTRVKHVAAYINSKLCDSKTMEMHINPRHALAFHIRKVISVLGTNFIPIGHLKIGFQCERALLFKVICDQVKIPTTLCKEAGAYYNEIGIFKSDLHYYSGYLVQKVFIVDLMEKVGKLIPKGSTEAEVYLNRYRTVF